MREVFKNLARQVVQEARSFSHDFLRFDVLRHAYAMSYISLLSLIPSLAAIFAVLSLFNPLLDQDSNIINQAKDFVLKHLATASGEQALSYIETFLANLDIKKIGISGFAGTLVTLAILLRHIEVALNKIFQVHKARPMVTRFVNFWTFLTLGSFSLALFVGTLSTYASDSIEIGSGLSQYANRAVLIVLFTLIYKLVPNCYVSSLWAFAGGVLSTTLLSLSGSLLEHYIVLFSNYQAIYGAALAALPIFLLWLYLIWLIILLGAIFAWKMQNRAVRTNDEQGSDLLAANHYLQAKVQSQLPFLVLELCFESFENNQGKGLKILKISDILQVPQIWVDQAIELLQESGLVIKDLDDPERPNLFPTRPYGSLSDEEIAKLIEDPGIHSNSEFRRIAEKVKDQWSQI